MLADHLSFVNAFVFAEPVLKGRIPRSPGASELIESIVLSRTVIATLRNLHFLDFRHIVSRLFVKRLKVFLMQREGLGALESQDPTPALRHRLPHRRMLFLASHCLALEASTQDVAKEVQVSRAELNSPGIEYGSLFSDGSFTPKRFLGFG